jgi:stage IV sporulation protein FB
MNARVELGRIAGIPIYLDMWFVLIVVLLSSRYFTAGDTNLMSIGVVVVIGLILSILLHELGHAFVGRLFKQQVAEIELGGFGGLCRFERSLPRSAFVRSAISLAGPAVNLGLWLGLGWIATMPEVQAKPLLGYAIGAVASMNLYLMLFNLLPAYPLDGGQTLDAWLGVILGPTWSVRVVATLGILVSVFIAFMALPTNFFLLLVALSIGMMNWQALQNVGGFGGGRRR